MIIAKIDFRDIKSSGWFSSDFLHTSEDLLSGKMIHFKLNSNLRFDVKDFDYVKLEKMFGFPDDHYTIIDILHDEDKIRSENPEYFI
jgi:hypothetical protein